MCCTMYNKRTAGRIAIAKSAAMNSVLYIGSGMMSNCLRIEIRKMDKSFGKNKWEIREGDISGSIHGSVMSQDDVLDWIKDIMEGESE